MSLPPSCEANTHGCRPLPHLIDLDRDFPEQHLNRQQSPATRKLTPGPMTKDFTENTFSLLHSGSGIVKHRLERQDHTCGEVPEWSNGAVSKTVVLAIVPWVRIPPSPPYLLTEFYDKKSNPRHLRGPLSLHIPLPRGKKVYPLLPPAKPANIFNVSSLT